MLFPGPCARPSIEELSPSSEGASDLTVSNGPINLGRDKRGAQT